MNWEINKRHFYYRTLFFLVNCYIYVTHTHIRLPQLKNLLHIPNFFKTFANLLTCTRSSLYVILPLSPGSLPSLEKKNCLKKLKSLKHIFFFTNLSLIYGWKEVRDAYHFAVKTCFLKRFITGQFFK